MSKLNVWKVRSLIVFSLTLCSLGLSAVEHTGNSRGDGKRPEEVFPEIASVVDALNKWSPPDATSHELDNDVLTVSFKRSDATEVAAIVKRAMWYAARMKTQCDTEPAASEFLKLVKSCLGDGGIHRGVVEGKKLDPKKLQMSLKEIEACDSHIADYFKWKRNKASDKSSDFAIDWEMEKKFKSLFVKLTGGNSTNADASEEIRKAITVMESTAKRVQEKMKPLNVKDLCRVTDSDPTKSSDAKANLDAGEDRGARSSGSGWVSGNGAAGAPAGKPAYDSQCHDGETCLGPKAPPAPANAIPAPAANGYGGVVPPVGGNGAAVVPNSYDPYGLGNCGAYGSCGGYKGGGYGKYGGAGYVPSPPPPGAVPPPPPFAPIPPPGRGVGVGVGVRTGGPRPPPPPPYPPMMPPPPPPIFSEAGAGVVKPWTATESITVAVTKKEEIPLKDAFPTNPIAQTCGKPVCMPMFGAGAINNRLGINPYIRNPYLPVYGPVMQPPSLMPPTQYPQNPYIPGGITPNPQYPYNPSYPTQPGVTPYYPQNPQQPIYGTPQIGYQNTPPTRYQVPRTTN